MGHIKAERSGIWPEAIKPTGFSSAFFTLEKLNRIQKVEETGEFKGVGSNRQRTKEHCICRFSPLTIIAKLFQVLAICHFYEQCGRKLSLWVVWLGNNEQLKMIGIDDLLALFSYGAN